MLCWAEKAPLAGDNGGSEENRDKVIIFVGNAYGIFHLAELAVLSGLRLHRLPPHLGSRQAILQRYGISP